jgi:hypothetical protein
MQRAFNATGCDVQTQVVHDASIDTGAAGRAKIAIYLNIKV